MLPQARARITSLPEAALGCTMVVGSPLHFAFEAKQSKRLQWRDDDGRRRMRRTTAHTLLVVMALVRLQWLCASGSSASEATMNVVSASSLLREKERDKKREMAGSEIGIGTG